MNLTGISGKIKAGSQLAASLTAYSYTGTEGEWTVEAKASEKNPYWLLNAPSLDLWLGVGSSWWIWKDVEVLHNGDAVTIKGAGRPEMR